MKAVLRRFILFGCAALLLYLCSIPSAAARLVTATPERTLSEADAIVVGLVERVIVKEHSEEATVRIEQQLKGDLHRAYLVLTDFSYFGWASAPDTFPSPGNRIFVTLKQYAHGTYGLWPDNRNLFLVENGHVASLYPEPTALGPESEEAAIQNREYVRSFDDYYQAWLQNRPSPAYWLPPKGGIDAVRGTGFARQAKPGNSKHPGNSSVPSRSNVEMAHAIEGAMIVWAGALAAVLALCNRKVR